MEIAEMFEARIREKVNELLSKRSLPGDVEIVETENLGEVVDKLVILAIRSWMLEDLIGQAKSDSEYALLRRKYEVCYKTIRPRLIQAINRIIDNAVINGRTLYEESVKIYAGVDYSTDNMVLDNSVVKSD